MMAEASRLPNLVQRFFAQHLCEHKHVSPRTVAAYRDTFRLFFSFVQQQTGRSPTDFQIPDLDASAVLLSSTISNPPATTMPARATCD